jgi:hypothetical protein
LRKSSADTFESTRALDRRALELLLSARGYTLEGAYRQARDEQDAAAIAAKEQAERDCALPLFARK